MHQDSPKCANFYQKKKTSTIDAQFYRNGGKNQRYSTVLSNSFFSVDKLSGSDADDKSVEAERVADDLYEGLLQEARDL